MVACKHGNAFLQDGKALNHCVGRLWGYALRRNDATLSASGWQTRSGKNWTLYPTYNAPCERHHPYKCGAFTPGLTGFSFIPVEKKLIVELNWEIWDLTAEEPPEYPDSGEPEDYILERPRSETAAAALGQLWEVSVPLSVEILRPHAIVSSFKDLRIDLSTWHGADVIRGSGYGRALFSERARDWFTDQWGEYVQFAEFPAT